MKKSKRTGFAPDAKLPAPAPETPFPFWPVSNGEWCPPGPTPKQRAAVKLYQEEADRRGRRLGLSRREFMRTAAGTATAFWVLNTVHGLPSHASEAVLPVTKEQCDDPEAAGELFSADFFVMDVQLHHVDLTVFPSPFWGSLRFFHPDDPPGLSNAQKAELLSQANFVKEVWVDSETALGVISGVPDGIPMPVETMMQTRDLVNGLAGSERAVIQAIVNPSPLVDPKASTHLSTLESQVSENGAVAVKCYTGNNGGGANWNLDDEKIAYPLYEETKRVGLDLISVHKGFPSQFGGDPDFVRTADLAKATADWPDLNFVIYHSGFFSGIPNPIGGFIDDIQAMGPRTNLYGEIGSSFATALVGGAGPMGAAHLLGQLLKTLGSWRVVWGTDSIWWGSPQWQIQALKVLQIPESLQEKHGYPALTDRIKARILGLNAARLYKVDIEQKRCQIQQDKIAALQREIGGLERSRTLNVYGPDTKEHYLRLLAHGGVLS